MGLGVSLAAGGRSVGPANKKPRAMGSRGDVSPSGLSSRTAPPSWLRRGQPCKGAGTPWGLAPLSLLAFFRLTLAFLAALLQRPGAWSPAPAPVFSESGPFQEGRALAAFGARDYSGPEVNGVFRNGNDCGDVRRLPGDLNCYQANQSTFCMKTMQPQTRS